MTEEEREEARQKRIEKAQQSLAEHAWQINATPTDWRVRTPNDTYAVTRFGNSWLCTCPDSQHHGPRGVDCKHIEGVRLWTAQIIHRRGIIPRRGITAWRRPGEEPPQKTTLIFIFPKECGKSQDPKSDEY